MGEEAEVKVFGVGRSPYSRRVEIALKLKGVQYEYIEEDLSNKSPSLLKYNPVHKKIPVLLHNGKPLVESLVILEYIDETWKQNPILPQDPHDRALARFWAKFIDDKCVPATLAALKGGGEKAEEEARECFKILEQEVIKKGDDRFFGGESIGFVDIAGCFIAHWVRVIQDAVGVQLLTEQEFPNLCKWGDDFVSSCTAVTETLPPKDELSAFFKARFGAANASKSK